MKTIQILLLIVSILFIISVLVNVWLGTELSQDKKRDCISLKDFNNAISEAQNKTTEIGKLYNQSQIDLSKCYSNLADEKEKKKPINITIDHVWTFVIGVTLGSLLWAFLRLIYRVIKLENKKK